LRGEIAKLWLRMADCLKIESSFVVSANAGTQNHRRLLAQKPSATVAN
jgi:hypothetical protein